MLEFCDFTKKTRNLLLVFVILCSQFSALSIQRASANMPSGNLLLDLRANISSSYSGSGTTWTDLSGNGTNATLQSTPTWSSSLGGSFALDGTDHFTLPSGFANFTTGLTISVYANFGSNSTTRNWERLVDFGNGAANNNILFARFDTTSDLTFEIYNGGTSQGHCRVTNGILENTWATYSVTLDGTTCILYRDGSWIFSTAYTSLPTNISRVNNYIGRSNWADAYFDTGIAAVAIYNRALNGTEVTRLSNIQKDSTAPTISGPSSATGATSAKSISENTTAVHTFTANETVSWSVSGTDSSFFSVNSNGDLTITARNFEAPADNGANNTYIVDVNATDIAGRTKSQTLTVTITNVNEAPSVSNSSSVATRAMSQAENVITVDTYTATDPDSGSSLSWSLSGTDAADFTVNSLSGVLTFATAPDFEAPMDSDANNVYIFVVTVSDGTLSDTQTVTLTVTNASEITSISAPTVSGTINKGIPTTITVTMNVAGTVRFFVGGKRISTCKARATSGSYPNTSATCSWRPPITGRQVLTATLTPTDNTFSASTSAVTVVQVARRSTPRQPQYLRSISLIFTPQVNLGPSNEKVISRESNREAS